MPKVATTSMNLTSACIATLINFCSDGCQKVKAAAAALQQIGLWMGAVAKKSASQRIDACTAAA
jgi:hypothetical protein